MSVHTQAHYRGKDSLYKFAEEWALNAYEFDIIKRIVRCRHKGTFEQDLTKTKIDSICKLNIENKKYIEGENGDITLFIEP